MTATEILRRMLDERGVEWANPNSCLRDEKTNWVANGFDYDALEDPYGTLILSAMHQDSLTPEQAIAATFDGGRLTAEQVRAAIFNGSGYASFDGAKYYADGIGMQAIADELNATLGSGTCKVESMHGYRCSNG